MWRRRGRQRVSRRNVEVLDAAARVLATPRLQLQHAPQVEAYKRDLAALDESIDAARAAMKRFRSEFEALRVALLVDRMSKSSTVAALAERRRKLAAEQEAFAEAVDAAKARAAAEEAAKWEAMCVRHRARRAASVGGGRGVTPGGVGPS